MHEIIAGKLRHLKGWKRNRPDHRDQLLVARATILPPEVDLVMTGFMPRVEDQADLGSCTANAGTSMMEFLRRKAKRAHPEYSRLFLYWFSRYIEGTEFEDSGAYIRDTMKALAVFGVCTEGLWPYKIEKFATKPNYPAVKNGLIHQALSYQRCIDLQAVKQCLADGFVVEFGFSVPESMLSDEVAVGGHILFPGPTENIIGGHAVLGVGYSDHRKEIKFQNSWGQWGDAGYGYLPYEFFTRGLADDCQTVRLAE